MSRAAPGAARASEPALQLPLAAQWCPCGLKTGARSAPLRILVVATLAASISSALPERMGSSNVDERRLR